VAMNSQTAREDAMTVQQGGALLAEASLGLGGLRDDISYYGVPFAKLSVELSPDVRLRKLLANMLYVGVMADLLGLDPAEVGKATFAIVQAEDELAALGMTIGAGWAGARAMTSTAGPGISLMSEFAGLAYFAEIPAVVWDIQRVGPSTGLPTRTSQADIISTF